MKSRREISCIHIPFFLPPGDQPPSEEQEDRQLFPRGGRRLPELRLLLLGERETGKTCAANTLLGQALFQAGSVTEECARGQAEVAGRKLTVVDTPGWEGGPEGGTPERVKREMVAGVALCPPGPHAVLVTLRVDVVVTAAVLSCVEEHMATLGEGVWRHTVLLFTHGDKLRPGVSAEQHIQSGGLHLRQLVERCSDRYHVLSNTAITSTTTTLTTVTRPMAQVAELLDKVFV